MSVQGKWFGYYDGQWYGPFDEPAPGVDVRASWFQFNPTSQAIFVSWGQFSTSAIDVRCSWACAWSTVPVPVGGGGGGEEIKHKKQRLPKASRDEKDLLEMLTILFSSGVLNAQLHSHP